MSGIDGKVVAITGASSGIGEATALELAGRGAAVVLGARRSDRLDDLARRIETADGRAAAVPVDVTQRADLERLVAHAVDRFGRLDVLVSNAGIARTAPLADLDVEGWESMIDVNLRGVLRTTSISPGFVRTELVDHIDDPAVREQAQGRMADIGIGPDAVARAVAFAIEQPDDVEIGDLTIRPTVQN